MAKDETQDDTNDTALYSHEGEGAADEVCDECGAEIDYGKPGADGVDGVNDQHEEHCSLYGVPTDPR